VEKVDLFNYVDEFGPAKIIHIYEPAVELKKISVAVNVAMSPFIGGVRIALDVSVKERFRLKRGKSPDNFTTGKYPAKRSRD
jgi:glutamate dehydrogenase (NAD(P)+)